MKIYRMFTCDPKSEELHLINYYDSVIEMGQSSVASPVPN